MTRMTRRDFGLLIAGSLLTGGTIGTWGVAHAQAQQVLKVGLIPSEDSRAMLAQSKDILDAVEKNSGMKVQGFVATDYNGVIEALRAKHLDIAYLGPFSYVLATTVTPVEAFAIAETAKAGRTYYHSKIIALKSRGIKTLDDLNGKNFAFVDPASTSGYASPPAGLPDGCAVDTVATDRIERLLAATPAEDLGKLFSAGELADAGDSPGRVASLAARFAAKEACLKLFPRETALNIITAVDFAVARDDYGAPRIEVSPAAEVVVRRRRGAAF